jgi:hypothetical protein
MSQLSQTYRDHLDDLKVQALVDAAKQLPETSLADLVTLAQHQKIADRVRVGHFVDAAPRYEVQATTRTPADRDALDEAIYQAIANEGAWISAENFRRAHFPSVTPLQFRKAVNRLTKAKKLKTMGQARGKRYIA